VAGLSPGGPVSAPAPRALLAVPGRLDTPTGGYGYARRLLAEARGAGLLLDPWPLPAGFPDPGPEAMAEALRRLEAAPVGWPLIVDGLALGVLPADALAGLDATLIALCHHPLALETGLAPARAAALAASERAALAACAHVIVTSCTTAHTLEGDYAVPPERTTVAPPGVDAASPHRGSWGEGPVRLLSVGALTPRKGHDVLLAALATLGDLDWRLTILGPADLDPGHAARLAARAAAPDLAGRVTLPGAADEAALAVAYDGADLFVLASRHEGFGMAYREAMAHGLPTVGCAAGAVPEATAGAAALVPPDDPAALAAALRPLIADPEALAVLAARSRAAAADFPSWADTARQVGKAVADAMEARAR
jgi:hypothetical protein